MEKCREIRVEPWLSLNILRALAGFPIVRDSSIIMYRSPHPWTVSPVFWQASLCHSPAMRKLIQSFGLLHRRLQQGTATDPYFWGYPPWTRRRSWRRHGPHWRRRKFFVAMVRWQQQAISRDHRYPKLPGPPQDTIDGTPSVCPFAAGIDYGVEDQARPYSAGGGHSRICKSGIEMSKLKRGIYFPYNLFPREHKPYV